MSFSTVGRLAHRLEPFLFPFASLIILRRRRWRTGYLSLVVAQEKSGRQVKLIEAGSQLSKKEGKDIENKCIEDEKRNMFCSILCSLKHHLIAAWFLNFVTEGPPIGAL